MAVKKEWCISIKKYWPRDDLGQLKSVHSVYKEICNAIPEYGVTRHTLTRAKEGRLAKADIANLWRLLHICRYWLNKDDIHLEDLIEEKWIRTEDLD